MTVPVAILCAIYKALINISGFAFNYPAAYDQRNLSPSSFILNYF